MGEVEEWLEQFRSLEKEWIGAALLKLLAIWPSNTVCEELFTPVLNKGVRGKPPKAKDWLDSYEHIIHNDVSHGASSTVILRFLKTCWGDRFLARVKPIDALPKLNVTEGTRILFLEDCIMTGQEAVETLKRAEIAQALKRGSVDFKVAVATRWGIERVRLCGSGGAGHRRVGEGLMPKGSRQQQACLTVSHRAKAYMPQPRHHARPILPGKMVSKTSVSLWDWKRWPWFSSPRRSSR